MKRITKTVSTFRLSPESLERITRLAERTGLKRPAVIEAALEFYEAEHFGKPHPEPRTPSPDPAPEPAVKPVPVAPVVPEPELETLERFEGMTQSKLRTKTPAFVRAFLVRQGVPLDEQAETWIAENLPK